MMTDRDTTTRTRARAPGVGGVFHRMAVHDRVLRPDSERTTVATTKCTKSGCKLDGGRRMPGAGLSRQSPRKAPLGQSAFQPYWGKLAVRNDRGDRGNVGIIRSPIRASILPAPERTYIAYVSGCCRAVRRKLVPVIRWDRRRLTTIRDDAPTAESPAVREIQFRIRDPTALQACQYHRRNSAWEAEGDAAASLGSTASGAVDKQHATSQHSNTL